MATEKLYYQDAHQAAFEARVVSCQPGKHGYDVVLDRTCFYPEGGGQPGDTGFLSGVRVTDTHERGGEIVHFCEQPLAVGQIVEGQIDYGRRFEFMQLHSGEHILSGVIHRRFGYENVGFHMGADFVTIDFSGMLTQEDLSAVEAEANEWVWKNVPIEITYPDAEALKTIPYRSKKELTGQVRIVTIPGADICACCGTHVSSTGEIGLIKIFSCVKFHDGVRLELSADGAAYLSALRAEPARVRPAVGEAAGDGCRRAAASGRGGRAEAARSRAGRGCVCAEGAGTCRGRKRPAV
ncbi:MAG: alanyl-tRNA editing protein [Oscillospiraceae bacterium]